MNGSTSIANRLSNAFSFPTVNPHIALSSLLTLALVACEGGGSSGAKSSHTVTGQAGNNGSITQTSGQTVGHGDSAEFSITPNDFYAIESVTSTCGGSLSGNTYTTTAVTSDCTVTVNFGPPTLSLTPATVKHFSFNWPTVSAVTEYHLMENADGMSGYTKVATIDADNRHHDLSVFLPGHINASYILNACNSERCVDSEPVFVSGSLVEAIGYVKASNTGTDDHFGVSVALTNDGNTLAVGASLEDSNATGIDGDSTDNSASSSGAVYIFTRAGNNWMQQAYLKASNTGPNDSFGRSVALSNDGSTLAVGAATEASNATGINGGQTDTSAIGSGAVYIFTRSDANWSQQAYLKASNTEAEDNFGLSVTLSSDGNTLATGAIAEASNATGINGDQADNSILDSGAVYIFSRDGDTWSQQAYIKASNTGTGDAFGNAVSLANDGNTLAVGAIAESSSATGIGGNQSDNGAPVSGAVYIFTRSGTSWSQQAYLKASNTGSFERFGGVVAFAENGNTLAVGAYFENNNAALSGAVYVFNRSSTLWSQQAYLKASNNGANDRFGAALALTEDGNTLAVGAVFESSDATGIGGDQTSDTASQSGAVYLFNRSGGLWQQQAYLKAGNSETGDHFGFGLDIAGDGSTLAVGAYSEDGNATGMDGDQTDNSLTNSGVVYLY